jgi:glycosyltransferase involved in cell wall biosynthesis
VDAVGPLSEADLLVELRSAKALVAPSLGRESFGIVLAEAFACATPVVASRIPGYTEVVRPGTGTLVTPGDPDALAVALVEFLENETLRQAVGRAARTAAETRYAWSSVVARLVEIYDSLVAASRQEDPRRVLRRRRDTQPG